MTENEKAAAWLGWTPGPCEHRNIMRCRHHDPAPDMAEPGNYMTAFELHPEWLPWLRISPQSGKWEVAILLPNHRSHHTKFEARTAGAAARKALAAADDARHAKDAE